MRNLLVLAAFALAACGAGGAQTQGLQIENGWASPTPGGVNASAGYLTIVNNSSVADRLISASSVRAASVDLHEMSMDGAIMRMRTISIVAITAHGRATLTPGGTHLMFNGVSTPFAEGERIPVQLTFEHAGAISAVLSVSRIAPEHRH